MMSGMEVSVHGGSARRVLPASSQLFQLLSGKTLRVVQSDQPLRYLRWSRLLAGFEFRILPLSVS